MTVMINLLFSSKAAQGSVKNMLIAFVKSQGRIIKLDWNKVLQQYSNCPSNLIRMVMFPE